MELRSQSSLSKSKYFTVFILILFSALAVRAWGAAFGLPFLYHADEPIVVNHALAYGSGDLHPHFFNIPPLTSYFLFFCYGLFFVTGKVTGLFHSTQEFIMLFLDDPSIFYQIGRITFGVFAGTATVALLMAGARHFISASAALAAGAIMAFNFLHARDSHYIYADIPLLLVLTGAFYAAVKLMLEPDKKMNVLVFGLWSGAAAAFKYNGIFIYAVFLPILWTRTDLFMKRIKAVFFASVITIIVFFVCNPYGLLDFAFFIKELREQSAANAGAGTLHHLIYSLAGGVGIPVLGLAFYGLLSAPKAASAAARTALMMASCFILCYYGVLVFKAQAYSRYVLPLIPFLCLLAGWGMERLQLSRRLFWIVLVLAVSFPAAKILAWDALMSRPDTRTQARDWVHKNIPAESSIALDWDFYMPRLNFSDQQLREKLAEVRNEDLSSIQEKRIEALLAKNDTEPGYNIFFLSGNPGEERFLFAKPVLPYSAEALFENAINYAIVVETHRDKNYDSFYEFLKNNAEEIAFFSPYRNPRQGQIDRLPLTGGPFLTEEIFARRSNGPIIRIYRLGDKNV